MKISNKSISICILCIIVSLFLGCIGKNQVNNNLSDSTAISELDVSKYVIDNYLQYKDIIKERTNLENSIIEEKNNSQYEKYIEFAVDNSTKIRFKSGTRTVKIIKEIKDEHENKFQKKLYISIYGLDSNSEIRVTLEDGGIIWCRYKINDLENVIPDRKVVEERNDLTIKQYISTEEIEELISKARSIYSVFEEIADEYNENLEENY